MIAISPDVEQLLFLHTLDLFTRCIFDALAQSVPFETARVAIPCDSESARTMSVEDQKATFDAFFAFALMWSIGGAIADDKVVNHRKSFNAFMKGLSKTVRRSCALGVRLAPVGAYEGGWPLR